jgi:Protein of unknown function (DUF3768)
MEKHSQTQHIAMLNDMMRQAPGLYGEWMQTQGIEALPMQVQSKIRETIETFDTFTEDNDPWGEHDFGSFVIEGHRINWKIDYYDTALERHSPDPADPTVTRRVLLVMLASEY